MRLLLSMVLFYFPYTCNTQSVEQYILSCFAIAEYFSVKVLVITFMCLVLSACSIHQVERVACGVAIVSGETCTIVVGKEEESVDPKMEDTSLAVNTQQD